MAITSNKQWGLLNQLQKNLAPFQDNQSGKESVATAGWAPSFDSQEFIAHDYIPEDNEERLVSMEAGILTLTRGKRWLLPVMYHRTH